MKTSATTGHRLFSLVRVLVVKVTSADRTGHAGHASGTRADASIVSHTDPNPRE